MTAKHIAVCISAVIAVAVMAVSGYADRRSFVWTYEYQTMPQGASEIEYYVTTEVPDSARPDRNTWKHWLELETGITDRWDVSLYQQFKQSNGASPAFGYDGFKLRTRYRIGEKGRLIVDPLLYLEYIRDDDLSKPNVLEGKLILAGDLGPVNVAYNQIVKQEMEGSKRTEHEYAAGVHYALTPLFSLGMESKGNYTSKKYYLGPTVSVAAENFWVSLGALWGTNDASDDSQTRMIVGVPF